MQNSNQLFNTFIHIKKKKQEENMLTTQPNSEDRLFVLHFYDVDVGFSYARIGMALNMYVLVYTIRMDTLYSIGN